VGCKKACTSLGQEPTKPTAAKVGTVQMTLVWLGSRVRGDETVFESSKVKSVGGCVLELHVFFNY
jgi:hypothetical protein